MSHFYPLEVVGRGSETQLQADKNLNSVIRCSKGYQVKNHWPDQTNLSPPFHIVQCEPFKT